MPNIKYDNLPEGYSGAIFIGTIIEELLARGHRVTAITTTRAVDGDYEIKKFHYQNFTWIVVPYRPHSFRFNNWMLGRILDFYSYETKKIVSEINKLTPDIIHAHWSYEFAKSALKTKYKSLITIHDNAYKVLKYTRSIYRFFRLIMSELNFRNIQYASTVSPYMLEYAQKRIDNVRVIPNPVPIKYTEEQISSFIKLRINNMDKLKIIMINNGWNSLKNVMEGVKSFEIFHKKFPQAELHLIGSGYEENGIAHKSISSLKIENIYFHGKLTTEELLHELESAHLLLHTAREESFGVVLTEAMSLGVPVIGGTTSGAVPWVINETRLLVDINNPVDISDKMTEVFSDKNLYTHLSEKCYKHVVEQFSSKSVVDGYLDYYYEIINQESI
ncbi:glycosyltransferase family 4 protein [Sulfurimonas sp. HSL-1656]|uniref:glycosyltransferase family 4 protein n=1 Tax=Thiomicrolovo subterrani TaxID=3131934 RepID=UPI0031F905D4